MRLPVHLSCVFFFPTSLSVFLREACEAYNLILCLPRSFWCWLLLSYHLAHGGFPLKEACGLRAPVLGAFVLLLERSFGKSGFGRLFLETVRHRVHRALWVLQRGSDPTLHEDRPRAPASS